MMNTQSNVKAGLFAVNCGLIYLVLMGIGFWPLAGFVPPPEPSFDANQIAEIFREDHLKIRLGFMFQVVAAFFYVGFTGITSKVLYQIEGHGSWLAFSNAVAGTVNVIFTTAPAVIWIVASFRPERDPELILLLNDLAWLEYLGTAFPVFFQYVCISIAAFSDNDKDPLFPRWLGYLNVWTFVCFIPLEAIFFFKTGPFAWSGLFGFYLPFLVFGIWFVSLTIVLRKAVYKMAEREEREA